MMNLPTSRPTARTLAGMAVVFGLCGTCGCHEASIKNVGGSGGRITGCAGHGACDSAAGGRGGNPGSWLGINWDAASDATSGPPECVRDRVLIERELPNVMLVIDGSGSMVIQDFDKVTRWQAIKQALIGEKGLVPRLQSQVRFGLTVYFSSGELGEPTRTCPYLHQAPVAVDNLEPIATTLGSVWPRGTTPTGETLERVWPALAALDARAFRGPRIILLATDGWPKTCDGKIDEPAQALTKAAVEHAFTGGVRTFVVSLGSEVTDAHLRELANLGQGYPAGDTTDRFYRVFDTVALGDALAAVASSVQDCVFELNGTVSEPHFGTGTVLLGGSPLSYQDADGWHMLGPNRISIDGAACKAIQSGAESVLDISFPCGVFIP